MPVTDTTLPGWSRRHIIILALLLLVLIAANLWLFIPRYFANKQLLTSDKLRQKTTQLSHIAQSGSQDAQKLIQLSTSTNAIGQHMAALADQTDHISLDLQSMSHPVSLNSQVDQTAQLAQIVSFTLRDLSLQPTNQLKAAQDTQVLSQAANTALSISNTK